jgi:SAM-dependent methyltransferase
MVKPYYSAGGASVRFYDLLTAADRSLDGDVELYAGLIPPGGSVLELGAGTGRVSQALAERGFDVTGLDIAPDMLKQAEARRGTRPELNLHYVRGDMTSLNVGRTFDAVICPFFALAHLPAGAAWRNVFRGTAAHLEPGGLAAFHLPDAEKMAAPPPANDSPVFHQPTEDGRFLTLYVKNKVMRENVGRMDITVEYVLSRAGTAEERSPERITFFRGDPNPFADQAGFDIARSPQPLGGAGHVHVYRLRGG